MPFTPLYEPTPLARPATWFAIGKRGLLARQEGARWALPGEEGLPDLGVSTPEPICFGRRDGGDVVAVSLPDDAQVPEGWSLLGLRTVVEAFDEETFAVAGRAAHVLDWATTNRFCGRCGAATERVPGEWCMKCPACALMMYPRIAPAVIVLVRKGTQALLARNARFPVPFYSTLAGFSEIGETLEETLHREVLEEVGIRIKDIRYFGSQPWPFPHSLMIAFTAWWHEGEIAVDQREIVDARWVSAADLPMIPPPLSIARRLVDAWRQDVATGGERAGIDR